MTVKIGMFTFVNIKLNVVYDLPWVSIEHLLRGLTMMNIPVNDKD